MATSPKTTIVDILRKHAYEHPTHRFLTGVDGKGTEPATLTYPELWRNAGSVSNLLISKGVKPGDRVMVAYPPVCILPMYNN